LISSGEQENVPRAISISPFPLCALGKYFPRILGSSQQGGGRGEQAPRRDLARDFRCIRFLRYRDAEGKGKGTLLDFRESLSGAFSLPLCSPLLIYMPMITNLAEGPDLRRNLTDMNEFRAKFEPLVK